MKRIVLLSDTHSWCDDRMCKYLSGCDEIWHAGDVGSLSVVNTLMKYAPVRAVYGNIDDSAIRCSFHDHLFFEMEGHRVLMTHIGGYPGRYSLIAAKLIALYHPSIFVCGHSHILKVIYDKEHDMLTLNPGASGMTGFHRVRTMLRFSIDGCDIRDMEIIEMPRFTTSEPNTIL